MAERISRRRALTFAAEGAVALLLVACGEKGSSQETTPAKTKTPTPPNTPKATETITPSPTAKPTEAPTVEPTPEPTPTPPTFEELEAAVNSAYAAVGLDTPVEIARQLKFCNEQDIPEDAVYTSFVVNGCGIVGEAMLKQFQETQNEVFTDVALDLQTFTFGKIDKFVTDGLLTQTQGYDAKILTKNIYFTAK